MLLVKHNWAEGKSLQFENRPMALMGWFAGTVHSCRTGNKNNQQTHNAEGRNIFVKFQGNA